MEKMNLIEVKSDDVFFVNMMYFSTDNMLMQDIYGKIGLGNRCFVHNDLWLLLQKLIPELKKNNLKLKICDAYRPPLAHEMMREIIPMTGFFAATPERSQHCHASAIDVVLLDENGNELEFPCQVDAYEAKYAKAIANGEWDAFKAHLERAKYSWNATEDASKIANRDKLRSLMEAAGFQAIEHEWWHFNLPNKENYPLVNFEVSETGEFIFS